MKLKHTGVDGKAVTGRSRVLMCVCKALTYGRGRLEVSDYVNDSLINQP